MVDQLARPKDQVEVYWFSEQPQGYVSDAQLEQFDSGRLGFPNTFFDPDKAHILYNEYHDQYALADEVGFDGIMTNEHHAAYWCGKPAVNLDAAVIAKVTKQAKIAILGNVIADQRPHPHGRRNCHAGLLLRRQDHLRLRSRRRGGDLQAGIDPTENRERFEEAHDLIVKCWTQPGPFRYEGKYYQYRVVNPWVIAHAATPARHLVPRHRKPGKRGMGGQERPPLHELGRSYGNHRMAQEHLH